MTCNRILRQAALLAAPVLAACTPWQTAAPVTAVSYQEARDPIGRKMGMLRRLAVIQLTESAPAECNGGGTGQVRQAPLDPRLASLLHKDKGYEVVDVPPLEPLAALGAEVKGWQSPDKSDAAGPALRALLDGLRNQDRVDALLVRLDRSTCSNARPEERLVADIVTMGLNELLPVPDFTKVRVVSQVWVFETLSGRLVWHYSLLQGQRHFLDIFSARDPRNPPTMDEDLLESLEPAIPKLLTR